MRKVFSGFTVLAIMLLTASVGSGVAMASFTGTGALDFNTCDTSQFNEVQVEQGDANTLPSLAIVNAGTDSAHVVQGTCSGDFYMPAYGKRIETRWGGPGSTRNLGVGSTYYMAWWTYRDPSNWSECGYSCGSQLVNQWRSVDETETPLNLDDRGPLASLTGCSVSCLTWQPDNASSPLNLSSPVVTGEWDGWLAKIVVSASPTTGEFALYKNGVLQSDTHAPTAGASIPTPDDYVKFGIYRGCTCFNNPGISQLWVDGATVSDTEANAETAAWGVASKTPARLYDTETGTAGTLQSAHHGEVGSSWIKHPSYTPTAQLTSTGTLRATAAGSGSVYYSTSVPLSATQDVKITAIRKDSATTGNIVGVHCRMDPAHQTMYDLQYNLGTGNLEQYKIVSGVATVIATHAETLAVGATATIEEVCNGTSIIGKWNGVQATSVTDSSITAAGREGLRVATSVAGDSNGLQIDTIQG